MSASLVTFMALAAWTGLFAKDEGLEKLEVIELSWDSNLDGATMLLENTGETAFKISQLRINNTLLSQGEWDCHPSPTLEPGDEAYIQVYPSLIAFRESSIYIFSLATESGKTYRRTFATPEGDFTFMSTEQLDVQGASFSGTSGDAANTIVMTVQNTGTADLTVASYKLGVSGTAHDITDVAVDQGASGTITCTVGADGEAWTSGTTYDIYLITSTGKQFPYRATAP